MNARERYLQILRRFGLSETTIRDVHGSAAGEDDSPAAVARRAVETDAEPTHERLARALAAAPHGVALSRDCWDHRLFAAIERACDHHDHDFRYSLPDEAGEEEAIELVYKTDDGDGWLSTVPCPDSRVGPDGTPAAFHLLEGRLLSRTDLTLVRLPAPADRWRGIVVSRDRLERLQAHYGDRIDSFAEPLLPTVQPGDDAPATDDSTDGADAEAEAESAREPAAGDATDDAVVAGGSDETATAGQTTDGSAGVTPDATTASGVGETRDDPTTASASGVEDPGKEADDVTASTTTADGADMTLHGGATTTAVSDRSVEDEDLPDERDFDALETSYGVSRDRVEDDATDDILSGLADGSDADRSVEGGAPDDGGGDATEPGTTAGAPEAAADAPDGSGFDFAGGDAEADLEDPFSEMIDTLEAAEADPDEVLEDFLASTPEDVVEDGTSQSALEAVHDALSDDREVEAFFEDSDLGTVDDDEDGSPATGGGSLSDEVASILDPDDEGDRGPVETVDEGASATFDGEADPVAPETTDFADVAEAEEISFGEDGGDETGVDTSFDDGDVEAALEDGDAIGFGEN